MNSNEQKPLRLMQGDWVNFQGRPAKISADGEMIPIVEQKVSTFIAQTYLMVAMPDLNPIPLTAEILRDWFGFECKENYVSVVSPTSSETSNISQSWRNYTLNFEIQFYHEREAFYVDIDDFRIEGGTMKYIQYVHELQHLYEALTGEMLERIDLAPHPVAD